MSAFNKQPSQVGQAIGVATTTVANTVTATFNTVNTAVNSINDGCIALSSRTSVWRDRQLASAKRSLASGIASDNLKCAIDTSMQDAEVDAVLAGMTPAQVARFQRYLDKYSEITGVQSEYVVASAIEEA